MPHMTTNAKVPAWTLADRLRKAREAAGLEQLDLARRTSISRATISAAENGHRVPTRGFVRLWAEACGVELAWLEGEPFEERKRA